MPTDKRISKFLSLVLRHRPEKINITLEPGGWANVELLLNQLGKNGLKISHNDLDRVVEENDKQRFAYSKDRRFIRASQGHSISVGIEFAEKVPPSVLYHGTTQARHKLIVQSGGLNKMNRHHVHLSDNRQTAKAVGDRHSGKTTILAINAQKMIDDGFKFYLSENSVWLVEAIPNKYIMNGPG